MRQSSDAFCALAAGIALDVALLDPPNALHPVALLGRGIGSLEVLAPEAPLARGLFGTSVAIGTPLVIFEVVRRTVRATQGRWVAPAILLALASSHRTLFLRVMQVRDALESGDLTEARSLLGRHLVSRETADLSASEVSAGAIESLAENLSDGVIAPWIACALGGAPLVWAYRASNTLDSMWGYRSERYEHLGKAAARLDDLWNLLPARATAGVLCIAAIRHRRGRAALGAWRRDRGMTDSPNAGQPMAAMAGATGVQLEKREAYQLNANGRPASPADITTALGVARLASAIAASATLLLLCARQATR